jgi:hypothetical protein
MTYDPYSNASTPPDPRYRDPEGGTGAGIMVGALMLLALGGFIYFYAGSSETNVATNDIRPPITQQQGTTGSASPSQ